MDSLPDNFANMDQQKRKLVKKIYLILKTREIKGEVVYVHLEGMPENKTHYPQSLELIT